MREEQAAATTLLVDGRGVVLVLEVDAAGEPFAPNGGLLLEFDLPEPSREVVA
jgi:hypothetical protein